MGDAFGVSDETSTPPDSTPRESQAEQLRSSALIPAAHAPPLPPPSAPAASPTPPPAKAAPRAVTRPPTSPDFSVVPRPYAPRSPQASAAPIAPKPASSNDVLRGTEAPTPVQPVLTKELQEQLFGVIRASLDATLGPLHDRQRALEARLEALKASPPIARPATAQPFTPSTPPVRAPQPSLSVDVTPSASVPPPAAVSPSLKPSVTSTSYGLVIDTGSRRPLAPVEQALANVGPIDMPDFGGNRRRVGRILVGLLLAVVVAAIIATILSYN